MESERKIAVKIVIFGGTGFIGRHLASYLNKNGYEVIIVSRTNQDRNGVVTWDELSENPKRLEASHAFINLAGETINQYWTQKAKDRIVRSRLETTKKIADMTRRLKEKPNVVINSSAIGIYGTSQTKTFTETNAGVANVTDDFLASVATEWERAADELAQYTRLIKLRLGVVFGKDGGAFPKMALPYKCFVGGRIGSGRQWLSWIHIDDLVRLIDFCIRNEQINGPVNATAPNPVTYDAFGRALANVMKRPHFFPVPSFLLKIVLGEMSQMLLRGQKVLPCVALTNGYSFQYDTIEKALQQLTE